jgi:hypothetical protein
MVNIVPVNLERHAGKGWRQPNGYAFAGKEAVVAIVGGEFPAAALSLPIGFVVQSEYLVPVVLTSPAPGRNVVIGPTGQWLVSYVPAALRAYPFGFARATESSQQAVLCIDEDSGLIVDADNAAERFFEPDGSPSAAIKRIGDLLRQIEESRISTNLAVVELSKAGVVKPWPLAIPVGEQQVPVHGLFCIDEAALNALADGQFLELRKSGALSLAYAQLLSMGQVGIVARLALTQLRMAQAGQQLSHDAEPSSPN